MTDMIGGLTLLYRYNPVLSIDYDGEYEHRLVVWCNERVPKPVQVVITGQYAWLMSDDGHTFEYYV